MGADIHRMRFFAKLHTCNLVLGEILNFVWSDLKEVINFVLNNFVVHNSIFVQKFQTNISLSGGTKPRTEQSNYRKFFIDFLKVIILRNAMLNLYAIPGKKRGLRAEKVKQVCIPTRAASGGGGAPLLGKSKGRIQKKYLKKNVRKNIS